MENIEKTPQQQPEKNPEEETKRRFVVALVSEMEEITKKRRDTSNEEAQKWEGQLFDVDEKRFEKLNEEQKKEIIELMEDDIENSKKRYPKEKYPDRAELLDKTLDMVERFRRKMKIIIPIKLPPEEK
ncbi:MAG: hypothetical protein M1334_03800 [Patescibacteria group bacterium]|nr:hypothetical protein [Patescibacteria group bacterium]